MRCSRGIRASFARAVLGGVLGVLPLAVVSPVVAGELGQVVAIDGDVFAQAPGVEPRRLDCNDHVKAGERVTTTAGGRVAILAGDVYTQVGSSSQVRFDEGPGQSPNVHVAMGRARVLDARADASAPALELSTPHARAQAQGTDTDVWVAVTGDRAGSTLCEQQGELHLVLTADGQHAVANAGHCTEIALAGGLHKSPQALAPIGDVASSCDDVLGPIAGLFAGTPDVAAPPPPPAFPDPPIVIGPPRGACDDPGSGCMGQPESQPLIVIEQPPVGGCFPGAPCGDS